MSFFVDSSVLYAAADSGDQSNQRAKEILSLEEARVVSDHVLAETWLLARHRLGRTAADAIWGAIRSGAARIEMIGVADLDAAWRIGVEFPDQDFSLIDRTSFAAMQRLGLTKVASFDSDFAIYRYGPSRSRAFELL